jgi:coatomer subunit beta
MLSLSMLAPSVDPFFSADMEVRRKAIGIVLSMTSTRNVEEVVLFLKKQLQKTQEQDYDKVMFFL